MNRPRAFTLIEAVMSAAIVGALSLGMVGALVVVAKAAPADDPALRARSAANAALDELCTEVRYATAVHHLSANRITITLPDRTGDGVAEVVEYRWAGAGAPLIRASGGDETSVLPAVHQFTLAGLTSKTTTTRSTTTTVNSGEVRLAKFDGWPLVLTPTSLQASLHATAWVSTYFKIDQVSLPANLSRLDLTKAKVRLRRTTSPTGSLLSAQVHLPATGTKQPSLVNSVGSPATLAVSGLTTTTAWYTFDLAGATFSTAPTELTLLLKGTGTSAALVQYYNSSLAPTDTTVYLSTANSGGSWTPSSNQQVNDLLFEVWGWYEYPATVTQSTDSYRLVSLAVTLASSKSDADALRSTVPLLNTPSVAGP